MCDDYRTPLAFKRSHEVKALCDVYYDQCLQDGYVTYCRYVVSDTIFFIYLKWMADYFIAAVKHGRIPVDLW